MRAVTAASLVTTSRRSRNTAGKTSHDNSELPTSNSQTPTPKLQLPTLIAHQKMRFIMISVR
jgi:hypothetical protein